jgi:hypothetical protein
MHSAVRCGQRGNCALQENRAPPRKRSQRGKRHYLSCRHSCQVSVRCARQRDVIFAHLDLTRQMWLPTSSVGTTPNTALVEYSPHCRASD